MLSRSYQDGGDEQLVEVFESDEQEVVLADGRPRHRDVATAGERETSALTGSLSVIQCLKLGLFLKPFRQFFLLYRYINFPIFLILTFLPKFHFWRKSAIFDTPPHVSESI
jgi:hypothetical protein